MEIILEHGSTEADGVEISDVTLKKKIVQQCDDEENSDTSQTSNSEIHNKTVKKRQMSKKAIDMSENSNSSNVSIVPKKKRKQERFDEGKTKNTNTRIQSRS